MRWTVDGYAGVHESLADSVNVVDAVGEVPKIAPFVIFLGIPVVRQLNLSFLITGRVCVDNFRSAIPIAMLRPA